MIVLLKKYWFCFSKRNRKMCDAIEESIRRVLNGYKFRQTNKNRVRVLTGNEEGTFGWITANLLNGGLNNRVVSNELLILYNHLSRYNK